MSEYRRAQIHAPAHFGEKLSDIITGFVGSYWFIWLHLIWFGAWIGFRVEAFPFGLLTMIVSLEAIILSTLVMISQNRQAAKDRKRDDHEAIVVDTMPAILTNILELVKAVREIVASVHQINREQSEILRQQSEILTLLKAQQEQPPARKR